MAKAFTQSQQAELEKLQSLEPEIISASQSKKLEKLLAQKAEYEAEAIEDGYVDTDGDDEDATGIVFVYFNAPQGQKFGDIANIPGVRSDARDGNGASVIGKYRESTLPREKWAQIEKVYGELTMFKSGALFAEETKARGRARVREMSGLRHGYEQMNPVQDSRNKSANKTTPTPENEIGRE